jgi:hypothetical protein
MHVKRLPVTACCTGEESLETVPLSWEEWGVLGESFRSTFNACQTKSLFVS